MSLINDALKRARSEALRQEAEGGRAHYLAVPAHSRRSSRSWLLFAGPPVVTAAVVFGLMAFWPKPQNEADGARPVAVEPVEEGPAVVLTQEEAPAAPVTSAPLPVHVEPVAQDEAAAPAPVSPPALEEPTPEPTRSRAGESITSEDGPRPDRRPQTTSRQGSRLEDGATYRRQATAADGSTVELGGIAYSDTSPIAVINGSVVSPGDMIAGFTVVAIDAQRVELEVDGVRIYVSLR